MMLCVFQVTRRGCVRLPPRQAHFLHRLAAIYKATETGLLLKPSQSSQSAKASPSQSQAALSFSKPITGALLSKQPWQRRNCAQKGRTRLFEGLSLVISLLYCKAREFWRSVISTCSKSVFLLSLSQSNPGRGVFSNCKFLQAKKKYTAKKNETPAFCHRCNTNVHILRSKCTGNEYSYCVHVPASRQFHRCWCSAQLWNRQHGDF